MTHGPSAVARAAGIIPISCITGGLGERFKPAVLKTADGVTHP